MSDRLVSDMRAPQSIGELFRVFNRLSLQGFGGVLPIAQHELVERERWLSKQQFVEMLSVSQVLPGPNVVNLSLMIGDRYFGLRGALAALAGMLAVPTVIVLLLAALYAEFAHVPWVAGALRGMGAIAAGLVIGTALKLLPALKENPLGRLGGLSIALLTLIAVGGLRWPLVWVIGGLGSLSVALAWWRLGRTRTYRQDAKDAENAKKK
jgi:chromate transporter